MKTLPKIFALGALAIAPGLASAVNKCTSPSGGVTYQAAPCSASEKSEQPAHIQSQTLPPSERWNFHRQKDEMTGAVTCFALSPYVYISWGRSYANNTAIRMEVAASPEGSLSITVRSTKGGPSFHPQISGSGIKIDANEFLPFTRSIGAHGLGFEKDVQPNIVGQLTNGKNFKARVRMWPYEELLDTKPISTTGFKGAMQQALSCANSK